MRLPRVLPTGTKVAWIGDSEDAGLVQRHGDAHEARHLAPLRAAGRGVVEIVKEGVSLTQGVAATCGALERGAAVVFQDVLAGGAWGDFLKRVERPSALGAWHYQVTGTKMKRKASPEARAAAPALPRPHRRDPGGRRSTLHVELGHGARATIRPWASSTTAVRAFSPIRRGSRKRGKYEPHGQGCCLIVSTSGCSSTVGGIRGLFHANHGLAAKFSLGVRPERRITGQSVRP
jgi:uncharacterized protein